MPVIERWQALLLMGFVQGESRSQGALFPVSLDELIPEDHLVRVIDLWVDRVDVALGFCQGATQGHGATVVRSGGPVEVLPVGLFEPDSLLKEAGAGKPSQPCSALAAEAADAGLQDHRQFSPEEWHGLRGGVPGLRGFLPG